MYLLVFSAVTHKYTEAAHMICALSSKSLLDWLGYAYLANGYIYKVLHLSRKIENVSLVHWSFLMWLCSCGFVRNNHQLICYTTDFILYQYWPQEGRSSP